jgi:hypothetical protein
MARISSCVMAGWSGPEANSGWPRVRHALNARHACTTPWACLAQRRHAEPQLSPSDVPRARDDASVRLRPAGYMLRVTLLTFDLGGERLLELGGCRERP